jgi:hypothetical protein
MTPAIARSNEERDTTGESHEEANSHDRFH